MSSLYCRLLFEETCLKQKLSGTGSRQTRMQMNWPPTKIIFVLFSSGLQVSPDNQHLVTNNNHTEMGARSQFCVRALPRSRNLGIFGTQAHGNANFVQERGNAERERIGTLILCSCGEIQNIPYSHGQCYCRCVVGSRLITYTPPPLAWQLTISKWVWGFVSRSAPLCTLQFQLDF